MMMEMAAESESETPVSSAPATPGTPGGLLFFGRHQLDSASYDRKQMPPRQKCFPAVNATTHHFPSLDVSLARKLGAEFVGTFVLIFAATAGPVVNQKYNNVDSVIENALCSGLAVMIVIFAAGHISGAHLNPSLTIAFATLRYFPWLQVPAYIATQVSASICASFAIKAIFGPFISGGVTVPSLNTGQAFALEFLITFNLLFVITAVATDTRAVGELAGVAVGATVMLNILIAGPSTGGSMNPVRTLGPAVAAGNYRQLWLYLVAPTLGAIVGAGTYTVVKLRGDEVEVPGPLSGFRR
ncbi:probable aquaporin NIP5-1 [Momordica charantia]|uniref:Probable aquaporin NIP5-1 n=1 Tax=Momordica charantia TaxID=3673 RepID=A0A6J1DZ41_MOMCH|nr:probable aquaporin NIP5-1 [Momordica charantia]